YDLSAPARLRASQPGRTRRCAGPRRPELIHGPTLTRARAAEAGRSADQWGLVRGLALLGAGIEPPSGLRWRGVTRSPPLGKSPGHPVPTFPGFRWECRSGPRCSTSPPTWVDSGPRKLGESRT